MECSVTYKKRPPPDKITHPNDYASANAEMIHKAMLSLDRTAREVEERWGVGRLETLADCKTAARFGSAKAKLDKAIKDNNAQEIVHRASVLQKGYRYLEKEARKNGHDFVDLKAWIWKDDNNTSYAFLKTNAEAIAYAKKHENVVTFTMEEVIRLAEFFNKQTKKLGVKAKEVFPAASITKIGNLDDQIPF